MTTYEKWKPFELLINDEIAAWVGERPDRFIAAMAFCDSLVAEIAVQINRARRNA